MRKWPVVLIHVLSTDDTDVCTEPYNLSKLKAKRDGQCFVKSRADRLSTFILIKVTPVIIRLTRIWSDKSTTTNQSTNRPEEVRPEGQSAMFYVEDTKS